MFRTCFLPIVGQVLGRFVGARNKSTLSTMMDNTCQFPKSKVQNLPEIRVGMVSFFVGFRGVLNHFFRPQAS